MVVNGVSNGQGHEKLRNTQRNDRHRAGYTRDKGKEKKNMQGTLN